MSETEADCHFPRFLLGVGLVFCGSCYSLCTVDGGWITGDTEGDVRIVRRKPVKTRDQPARCERVWGHHIENKVLFVPRAFNAGGEAIEPLADALNHRQAVFAELQHIQVAVKKEDAEIGLKIPDLLTDGGGRDVQLLCCLFKAQVAGGDFEKVPKLESGGRWYATMESCELAAM